MTSGPEDLAKLLGEDPLTRLELDWDLDTMRQEIVRLGLMLEAAGVEDFVSILNAIQPDVERMVSLDRSQSARGVAGTLVMESLNRALRKSKSNCRFEPIEGERAWRLKSKEADDAGWPPWFVPELLAAVLGFATFIAISSLLFTRSAYPWLVAYLVLTAGGTVVSIKAREKVSASSLFRGTLSLFAIGASAIGVAGLYASGEPGLGLGFAMMFAVLHLSTLGLNAWKKSTMEQGPVAEAPAPES